MAKTNSSSKMVTPKYGWRGTNEFVQPAGIWHPHITAMDVIASEDGFKAPKVVFSLVGPGTLGAQKVDVKFPYELDPRTLPNGERAYTELAQFFFALQLLSPEDMDNEEVKALFDMSSAVGLAIQCQTVRQEVVKKIGTTNIVTSYTSVVPTSIKLEA